MSERIVTFWQEEVDKEEDALLALKNMGITYYRRMQKHPAELKVQFQAIAEIDDKDIARQLHSDHEAYMSFIEKVLKKAAKQGTVAKNLDIRTIVFMFNGGGIMMNMMKLLSFDKEFNEEAVSRLMDHFINSIKK